MRMLRPKRRWLRFGMRSMLLLTTVVGSWLGWQVNRVRREREALVLSASLGGKAYFDYQRERDPQHGYVIVPDRKSPRTSWFKTTIGDEYFRSIVSIDLRGTNVTDDDLKVIAALPDVVTLELSNTKVTDVGLERLERARQLEYLDLSNTPITNAGLVHLKGLQRLRSLLLINTKIDSGGLIHLAGLKRLDSLSLWKTRVDDAVAREVSRRHNRLFFGARDRTTISRKATP